MQVGLGHRRTVDLRLHHDPHHGACLLDETAVAGTRFASVRR